MSEGHGYPLVGVKVTAMKTKTHTLLPTSPKSLNLGDSPMSPGRYEGENPKALK
jgi:hypothetical protein